MIKDAIFIDKTSNELYVYDYDHETDLGTGFTWLNKDNVFHDERKKIDLTPHGIPQIMWKKLGYQLVCYVDSKI